MISPFRLAADMPKETVTVRKSLSLVARLAIYFAIWAVIILVGACGYDYVPHTMQLAFRLVAAVMTALFVAVCLASAIAEA